MDGRHAVSDADAMDELSARLGRIEGRLDNIEFVLGISPMSVDPLHAENVDELRDRIRVVELATGIGE